MKRYLFRLGIMLSSVVLLFIVAEITVRVLLSPSDIPDVSFDAQLGTHYVPHQYGYYKKGKEIHAEYRINNVGWNSIHDYQIPKSDGIYRIAVIGDSFVEGFEVDVDKTFPSLLEKRMNDSRQVSPGVQVYPFGHSGANMVQYIHELREAITYAPNLIIVLLVENDFTESISGSGRNDQWAIEFTGGLVVETPPRSPRNLLLKKMVRTSALARFLLVNEDLLNRSSLLRAVYYGGVRPASQPSITQSELNLLVPYALRELKALADSVNAKLMIVIEPNRGSMFYNRFSGDIEIHSVMSRYADILSVPFVDLTQPVTDDWNRNKQMFDWKSDYHWNGYAHQFVAEGLVHHIAGLINE